MDSRIFGRSGNVFDRLAGYYSISCIGNPGCVNELNEDPMRIITPLAAAFLSATVAAPALADAPKVYAYPSKENYCPAGLQPVTISGVICCGTPNQTMTYQQVMAHPVVKKKRHVHKVRHVENCPEGVKGCF